MYARLWPDRIVVQIIERRPYALWQHEGQVRIVDKAGHIISEFGTNQFANLPLVVGPDAALNMTEVQSALASYPELMQRVDAMVQLPSGRWDIRLDDGVARVKLPLKDLRGALGRLASLQHQKQILDRDIAVIDLRLRDRVSLTARHAAPV